MSPRPSLSLVYGVRIAAADVDRVRALCDAGALPGCEVWDGGKVAQPHAIVGATGSLRPLVTCDGDLADGLPLDVAAMAASHVPREQSDAVRAAGLRLYTRPGGRTVDMHDVGWWIVGRVS